MIQENILMNAIAGKSELSEATVEEWEAMLTKYPAFGTGHLILAKKLLHEKHTSLPTAQQKAAIHFNDLHWLDYLLKGPAIALNNQPKVDTPIPVPEPETELVTTQGQVADNVFSTENQADTPEIIAEPATVADREVIEPLSIPQTNTPVEEEHPRLSSILSAQLADFQKPIDHSAVLPTDTEPLYKTDYFASQGILQVKTEDELGKKVKKFTDWLKDMKKNDTSGVPVLPTTEQEEAQIINKAAASLKTEVVLTESMAEVLLQQGKTEQAKTVYQKLSLLYPEKSSYFATKIDSLL